MSNTTKNESVIEADIEKLDQAMKAHFKQYQQDCEARTKEIERYVRSEWFTERQLYIQSMRKINPAQILPLLVNACVMEQRVINTGRGMETQYKVCIEPKERMRLFNIKRQAVLQELSDLNYSEIAMREHNGLPTETESILTEEGETAKTETLKVAHSKRKNNGK